MTTPPAPAPSKLQQFLSRSLSSVALLALFSFGVAMENKPLLVITLGLLCTISSIEWFQMLATRKHEVNRWFPLVASLLLIWGSVYAIFNCSLTTLIEHYSSPLLYARVTRSLMVFYLLIMMVLEVFRVDYSRRSPAEAFMSSMAGAFTLLYPNWLLAFAFGYLMGDFNEVYLLVWLVLVTKMSDIAAYCCGSCLGRRWIKRGFSPALSPNKSWEGIIGSFIITLGVSFALFYALPLEQTALSQSWQVWVLTPFIFALSVIGDLMGSLVKRALQVKDSGKLLPGIGGVYDLLDSPAFTVPFFTVIIFICN